MAAVKIKPPRMCPREVREHLRKRVDDRHFIAPMAIELDAWLKRGPYAPDLNEAPQGWHKCFDSFTICGEADCIKTLYTIYAPGNPRPKSVDLDEWERRGRKPPMSSR
jgi:hypothetical protein